MLMSKKVQKNYSMITTGFVEQDGGDNSVDPSSTHMLSMYCLCKHLSTELYSDEKR